MSYHRFSRFIVIARGGFAAGMNITATLRLPQTGQRKRSDSIHNGKSRPLVATRVTTSRSCFQLQARAVFSPSRFPHAQRAFRPHPASIASPIVSAML
jgi:hypothetical protein